MKLTQFSYDLPQELIAQTPLERRDASRLLHLNRSTATIAHQHFSDLPQLLRPGDLLVLNNTKVLPVRLVGQKATGGSVEVLLTKRLAQTESSEEWEALTRPGLKVGQKALISNQSTQLVLECIAQGNYTRRLQTSISGEKLLAALDQLGSLPTPPYIKEFAGDPQRYQTIFASSAGSAAAPTAGLHFSQRLFQALDKAGIQRTEITLHVGLGTFLPVKEVDITKHQMHAEWYEIPAKSAELINQAKQAKQRVVAVGTTSLRTLESAADEAGQVQPGSAETSLFVYPPHRFRCADALITNFHLPQSTLLMLVSAFTSWPQTDEKFSEFQRSLIGRAYTEAIAQRYRFFSFGDAMLIE